MPTNQEWLHKLANESPDELKAWFDAEHNDNLAAEKVVSCDAAHSNDGNAHLKVSEDLSDGFTDSREQLELDIDWCLGSYTAVSVNVQRLRQEIIKWLDRQAAITEREKAEKVYAQSRDTEYLHELKQELDDITNERNMLQRRNSELRTQYDKLKRERDYWREQMLNCVIAACRPGGYTKGVMDYPREDEYAEPSLLVTDAIECMRDFNADIARLNAERDNLAADLLACNREREQLREHLGIALDHAHDICSLVDIDGNVLDVGE